MICRECKRKMFFRTGEDKNSVQIVCPKCKKVISGKHTAKTGVLLQDVKLKELEIEI